MLYGFPEPHLEKVNVNQLIRSVADILYFKANATHIYFEFDLTSKPIWVLLDINQMEQVLINIIKNALESIQQKRAWLINRIIKEKLNL
jgi:nitrogen fixation/metabolism regulation signal transduction histidine kinase